MRTQVNMVYKKLCSSPEYLWKVGFEQTTSSKMVQSMLSRADIDEISSNPRKWLRDHELRKSEGWLKRIVTVLKEDFVNLCSDVPNKQNLYNIRAPTF